MSHLTVDTAASATLHLPLVAQFLSTVSQTPSTASHDGGWS